MFPDDERLFNMSMLVKDDVFCDRQRQAYLEKRNTECSQQQSNVRPSEQFNGCFTTERYETPGGVGRLTRSKVTNFPYTARIEMSKVILFRNDKSRWSMLSPVFQYKIMCPVNVTSIFVGKERQFQLFTDCDDITMKKLTKG